MLLGREELPHFVDLIGVGLMADQGSDIKLIFQDPLDGGVLPQIAVSNLGLVITQSFAQQLLLIVAGGGDPLVVQLLGNGLDAVARYVEAEDLPYDFGVLLDDDDLVRVLILEVSKGRDQDDAVFLLLLVRFEIVFPLQLLKFELV